VLLARIYQRANRESFNYWEVVLMIIKLSPLRLDETLEASVVGDVITLNGQAFDFTQLPEGATLPADAIDSEHFVGPVERINGELHLTLRLPHGANPSQAVAFPAPITVTINGPVALPFDAPQEEVIEVIL
jgi:hypothetical protein